MSHQPDNPVPLFGSGPRRSLNPTAAGIVLGTELRRMRAERRLTATRAATLINASVSKVSRLERAESPPDPRDIEILADAYGVNPAERAQLRSLTRRAREPEWFDRYTDCAASWMQRLIALESDAVYYCAYEARLAPGLLQTPEYARQIISDGLRLSEGDRVEQRVLLRQERQRRFFGQPAPPVARFLLDESVLHRQVGTPAVMAGQLRKLLEYSDRPGVTLLVVPLNSSVVSNHGSMAHLRFASGGPPAMVFIEGDDDAMYYVKPDEVERRVEVMLRLSHEAAVPWRDSRAILLDALKRYEDG
ncbi:helix-turn-helix domain-containing protein [Streptomyces sp. NBC_01498]|uniref:helix-turn-helix domain-containing protein n=1 Tax=Streptomyces sp. NBC_01498 TaxID=2975870 RepID=UPI002E7AD444|nr:helix-turn-helix transcriptional regulator [Streptomyces sp. NBC_01498]WTL28145.1 helix-turn-helix domain-containing protein [Streptomyces sp. NBC_01498]